MKTIQLSAMLAMTALLSACGTNTQTTTTNETATTTTSNDSTENMGGTGNMAMPAAVEVAKSAGTVTAIDKAAGKITLDHAPIPEVNWPAMTMAFEAKPAILDSVVVGDKVAFDVTITANGSEVTAIAKQ